MIINKQAEVSKKTGGARELKIRSHLLLFTVGLPVSV